MTLAGALLILLGRYLPLLDNFFVPSEATQRLVTALVGRV